MFFDMFNSPVPSAHLKYYLAILIGMCVVILSALAFEHLGGYIPCKLCLEQREPWYIAIPILAVACLSLIFKGSALLTRGLLVVGGLIMLYSFWLGINHSGVEWGFWEGPTDCGAVEGGLASTTTDFLQQLEQTIPPSCTEAALRVFGLSFAGWNAVMSLVLAASALLTSFIKS